MKQAYSTAIIAALCSISSNFVWNIAKDGSIVGTAKGKRVKHHSPLTAIVNEKRRQKGVKLLRQEQNDVAAKELGLNINEAETFIAAITGKGNRGYVPRLRGKLKKTLGL